MHNLKTVFLFELTRTLKKKSFWLLALSFPLLMIALFSVVFFSNKATADAEEKMKDAKFSIQITDESGLVNPVITAQIGAHTVADRDTGIRNVREGKVDAYFYYPKDISKQKVEVYGKDIGIFENGKYDAVAKALLEQSVAHTVSPNVKQIIKGTTQVEMTAYRDGEKYDAMKQIIAPGIFIVLFYFLIAMFGGQMLTSTTEEKENRVIEMILTTVEARTLIVGKILALIILSFVQGLMLVAPAIIGYIFFKDALSIPSFDLSSIPIDPVRIGISAILFALSFLLFTGILVAIGAAAPTAKEANGFMGVIFMCLFMPLYAVSLFVSAPHSLIVQVLTFFPLTAPLPSLIRNALGNLSALETLLLIVILAASAVLVLLIAVRLFRYGAIEYSKKVSPLSVLRRHS